MESESPRQNDLIVDYHIKKPQKKFSSALSEHAKTVLGTVNLNWFSEANDIAYVKEPRKKGFLCEFKTPQGKDHEINTLTHHGATPSLFSPDEPKGANLGPGNSKKNATFKDGVTEIGLSSPLPGITGDTPIQANIITGGNYTTPGITSLLSSPHISYKQLFKTPGTVRKSHCKNLAISLGVDLNESNASWTSSLVTPSNKESVQKKLDFIEETNDDELYTLGAARALFTPGHDSGNSSQEEMAIGLNSTVDTESECEIYGYPVTKEKKWKKKGRVSTNHQINHCNKPSEKLNDSNRCSEIILSSSPAITNLEVSGSVPDTTNIDDVLSVFVSPPSQSSVKRKTAPRKAKRKVSHKDILLSPIDYKKARLSQNCKESKEQSSLSPVQSNNELVKNFQLTNKDDISANKRVSEDECVALIKSKQSAEECDRTESEINCNFASRSSDTMKHSIISKNNVSGDNFKAEDIHLVSDFDIVGNCNPIDISEFTSSQNGMQKEKINVSNKPKSPPTIPREDFFTQISPTALSAMCSAAGSSGSCSQQLVENYQGNNNREKCKDIRNKLDSSNVIQTQETNLLSSSKQGPVKMESTLTKYEHSPLFFVKKESSTLCPFTPVKWKNCPERPAEKEINNSLKESQTPQLSISKAKPLSLKSRRAKRFSYPTFKQIVEVCPKKVFNFNTEETFQETQNNLQVTKSTDNVSKLSIGEADISNSKQERSMKTYVDKEEIHDSCDNTHTQDKQGEGNKVTSDVNLNKRKTDTHDEHRNLEKHRGINQKYTRSLSSGFTTLTDYAESSSPVSMHPTHSSTLKTVLKKGTQSIVKQNMKLNLFDEDKKTDNETVQLNDKIKVSKHRSNDANTCGFSSASGKAIYLSDSSVNKALKLIHEVDVDLKNESPLKQKLYTGNEENINESRYESQYSEQNGKQIFDQTRLENNTNRNDFQGFSSASGKSIHISEKAKQKAQAIIKEITQENIEDQMIVSGKSKITKPFVGSDTKPNHFDNKINDQPNVSSTVGFSSASGKAIKLSDIALKKANILINSIGEEEINDISTKNIVDGKMGFHLVSGKSVVPSDSSIERAHKIMQQVSADIQFNPRTLDHNLDNLENTIKDVRNHSHRQIPSHNNLPQGLRPFKPPRSIKSTVVDKITGNEDNETQYTSEKHAKQYTEELDKLISLEESEELDKQTHKQLESEAQIKVDESIVDYQDEFTLTQKMEIRKSTTVFLELDLETQFSFSQTQQNDMKYEDMKCITKQNLQDGDHSANGNLTQDNRDSDLENDLRNSMSKVNEHASNHIPQASNTGSINEPNKLELKTGCNKFLVNNISSSDSGFLELSSFKSSSACSNSKPGKKLHQTVDEFTVDESGLGLTPGICSFRSSKDINTSDCIDLEVKSPIKQKQDNHGKLLAEQTNAGTLTVEKMETCLNHVKKDNSSNVHYFGIQTSSGKSLSVSNKSLESVKCLLESGEVNAKLLEGVPCPSGNILLKDELPGISGGFKKVSDRRDNMCENRLQGAKALTEVDEKSNKINNYETNRLTLSDVQEGDKLLCRELPSSEDNQNKVNQFVGFQTAGGKSVSVCEKSLNAAKKLIGEDSACSSSVESLIEEQNNFQNNLPSGFQIASGKSVTNLDESFKGAKTVLERSHIDSDVLLSSCHMIDKQSMKSNTMNYEIVNGHNAQKEYVISQKSDTHSSDNNKNYITERFVGFQTAAGNNINVSEKSLKAAKTLLENSEDIYNDITAGKSVNGSEIEANSLLQSIDKVEDQTNVVALFQTSAEKSEDVTDKSLETANSLLESNENVSCQEIEFTGFKTSRGKSVNICENSLKIAKSLVANEERINNKINRFNGFQSECGKSVNVSENSLKSEKSYLQTGEVSSNSSMFAGFQTASGKSVNVNENSLKKARSLFESSSEEVNYHSSIFNEFHTENENLCKQDYLLGGFQTASGKAVKVSEENLKAAKSLIKSPEKIKEQINVFPGFHTATGKSVNVSENSLKIAKSLLETNEVNSNVGMLAGFQTAGGKSVKISEENLKAARSLIESPEKIKDQIAKSLLVTNEVNSNIGMFAGFQTAGGKSVKISEENLKAARSLIESPKKIKDQIAKSLLVTNEVNSNMDMFAGFQTAGGKSVKISEENLKAARSLIESPKKIKDQIAKSLLVTNEVNSNMDMFAGFQTAGGKSVKISEENLKAARSLIKSPEKIKDQIAKSLLVTNEVNSNMDMFAGFHTAGGKSVHVSEKSLQKAQTLLENTEDVPNKTNVFPGFQTATGKSVHVSEKSLKAAKSFLESDKLNSNGDNLAGFQTPSRQTVIVNENSVKTEKSPVECNDEKNFKMDYIGGFQTAGGKLVKVSDSSLKAATALLQENENFIEPKFTGFQTQSEASILVRNESFGAAKVLPDKENIAAYPIKETATCSSNHNDGLFKAVENISTTIVVDKQPRALKNNMSSSSDVQLVPDISSKVNQLGTEENQLLPTLKGILKKPLTEVTSDVTKLQNFKDIDAQTCESLALAISKNGKSGEKHFDPKSFQSCDTDEGIKALLEDGDFYDSDSFLQQNVVKPWMKSVNCAPEGFVTDRNLEEDNLPLKSLVTAPSQDIKMKSRYGETYRWQGPTNYNKLQPKSTVHDRYSFLASNLYHPADRQFDSGPSARIHNVNQFNNEPGHSSWKTPVKSHKGSSFTTPIKTGSSFKTPVKKKESSSFITPVKKVAEKSSFITPIKQKPVTENSKAEDNSDSNLSDKDADIHHIDKETLQQLMKDDFENDEIVESHQKESKTQISDEVKKKRLKSKVAQAQDIKNKKMKADTRPCIGKLLCEKIDHKQPAVKDVICNGRPRMYTDNELYSLGVRKSTLSVNSKTAIDFRFNVKEYFGEHTAETADGIWIGDGAFVVMDEYSNTGKEEFCNGMFAMKGVEPKLVTRDWVYNHFRWIVWKLAAYETRLPHSFAGRCLTPDQVMLQLKYRYDREIDRSHRSALKKIYEKDDSAQKCMVLCVSDIPSELNQLKAGCVIELTDGWYSIKALIDSPLSRLIHSGKLRAGDKIVVYGAERLGCQDGCLPLEAPPDIMLKIHANSCRRVKWNAKLGFCRNPQPMPVALSSLYPDGGLVGCLNVIVTRVYPLQYLEKQPDGSSVFRCARAEEHAAKIYERDRQRQMETLHAKLQQEYEKKSLAIAKKSSGVKKWSAKDVDALQNGEDLLSAYKTANDPSYFESLLSSTQHTLLYESRSKAQAEDQAEMQSELSKQLTDMQEEIAVRNVTPLLKVRIASCNNSDIDSKAESMLTMWKPKEDVIALFKEGHRMKIYNCNASEIRRGQFQSCTSCRVNLTGTRTTCFQPLEVDDNFLDLLYEPREVAKLSELQYTTFEPPYGETDIVGVVIKISQPNVYDTSGGEGFIQTVYLADINKNIAGIKFWGKLSNFCLEELLTVGTCVACTNLIYKTEIRHRIPIVTASDMSTFTTNPRQKYLKVDLENLEKYLKTSKTFIEDIQVKLQDDFNVNLPKRRSMNSCSNTKPTSNTSNVHSHNISKSNLELSRTFLQTIQNVDNKATVTGKVETKFDNSNHSSVCKPGDMSSEIQSSCASEKTPMSTQKVDSLVEKQQSLQKSKAEKLEVYMKNLENMASPISVNVTNLVSPIPTTLKKTFRAPGLRRRSFGNRNAIVNKVETPKTIAYNEQKLITDSHGINHQVDDFLLQNSDRNISKSEVYLKSDSFSRDIDCTSETNKGNVDITSECKLTKFKEEEPKDVCLSSMNLDVDVKKGKQTAKNRKRKTRTSDPGKHDEIETCAKRRKSLRLSKNGQ